MFRKFYYQFGKIKDVFPIKYGSSKNNMLLFALSSFAGFFATGGKDGNHDQPPGNVLKLEN